MIQILKNFILIFFLYFLNIGLAYSENITGANTVNKDNTTQKKFNADDTSLTITNSATLSFLTSSSCWQFSYSSVFSK